VALQAVPCAVVVPTQSGRACPSNRRERLEEYTGAVARAATAAIPRDHRRAPMVVERGTTGHIGITARQVAAYP